MSYPNYIHYEAALHLLRYLSGTIHLGIGYRSTGNRRPHFYADSDDGTDETRRSCAGYMSFLADGPIYWKSKMLDALSLSSCESEIRAINMAMEPIKESIKMKMLLTEIENKHTQLHVNIHRGEEAQQKIFSCQMVPQKHCP
jgi:hypothetical protein